MTTAPKAAVRQPLQLDRRLLLPAFAFAAFLNAGRFKVAPVVESIPIDLTLVLALVVVLLVGRQWLRDRMAIPNGAWVLVVLFGSLLVAGVGTPLTDYGQEKIVQLLTLTLLSATAPLFLFRTRREASALLVVLAVVGLFVAVTILIWGETSDEYTFRAGAFGTAPIGSAIAAGSSLVLVVAGLIWRSVRWHVGVTAAILALSAMIATGSRGPLAAAAIAVGLMLVASVPEKRRGPRAVLILAVLATGFVLILNASNEAISTRFDPGVADSSTNLRLTFLRAAWDGIATTPEGVGWGNFYTTAPDVIPEGNYPHNVIAEVFLEAGWLSGLVFVSVLGLGAYGLVRQPPSPVRIALLALLVFHVTTSMLSLDVNESRHLFAVLGVALAASGWGVDRAGQEGELAGLERGVP